MAISGSLRRRPRGWTDRAHHTNRQRQNVRGPHDTLQPTRYRRGIGWRALVHGGGRQQDRAHHDGRCHDGVLTAHHRTSPVVDCCWAGWRALVHGAANRQDRAHSRVSGQPERIPRGQLAPCRVGQQHKMHVWASVGRRCAGRQAIVTCSPRLKEGGGCSGDARPNGQRWRLTGLPSPTDVSGRVLITVEHHATAGTDVGAHRQAFHDPLRTAAPIGQHATTVLAGVLVRHRDQLTPGACCKCL